MQEVIWTIEPHTKAKHDILRKYLQAWFPIIAFSGEQRLIYLDGFAGPGEYTGGEEGSPVIALRTLIDHRLWGKLRKKEFIFFFIEKKRKRAEYLENLLKDKFPGCPSNISYYVRGVEFEPTLTSILDNLEEVPEVEQLYELTTELGLWPTRKKDTVLKEFDGKYLDYLKTLLNSKGKIEVSEEDEILADSVMRGLIESPLTEHISIQKNTV